MEVKTMLTISHAIDRLADGADFYITMGDFLDEFYRQGPDSKQTMIAEEPAGHANISREHAALFAATAHKLANDFGLNVPKWVMDGKFRITDKPYFDCNENFLARV